MLKKILIAVAVFIVGVLGYAAMQPNEFRVERSVAIKAPPDKIYPLIADFHRWSDWSPWEKLDPAMKRTFSGPASGQGAVYEWVGNSDVGSGRMEITALTPPSKVEIKLDFITPFEGHDLTVFSLAPQGDQTKVTWTMSGPNLFISKVMGIFVSMDTMIGKDFEKGLSQMKAAAEK
jgi:uncharacterized protein YndB with AHSA1/START domain